MSTEVVFPESTDASEAEVFVRAGQLVQQSSRVPEISDGETAARAGDLAKFLKVAGTKVDELRDARVRPLNNEVKAINASFRPVLDAIEAARKSTLAKVTAWQVAEDKRRREEAERERQEALRRQRESEEEALRQAAAAEATGDSEKAAAALESAVAASDATIPVVPTRTSTVSRGDYGSTTSLRDNWSAVVTDFSKLPDTFKVVNEAALRGLKSTRPDIPGVQWVNNPTAVTR